MAHILLIDVPGGNDFTILEDAVRMGHEVTFYTSDLAHYQRQGNITAAALALAREVIEIRPFDYAALESSVTLKHKETPFDAILCLIDIRLIEASKLADKLGLRFMSPATATLMRDKFSVREVLAENCIHQPRFALARNLKELRHAVKKVGYPALVKPSDGYGSQNISVLFTEADLQHTFDTFAEKQSTDYGLGVYASNRFSVEQYVRGHMIGCDVFSDGHTRVFLGINDKLMFPPPSFSMRGSCFPSDRYDTAVIRDYAYAILDAVNYNFGAAHIEMIVAEDGRPYLVEVNARLVSAQIPFQMGYAMERSIYEDLINLHLGMPLSAMQQMVPHWFSAIRWITTVHHGILKDIRLPEHADPLIRRVAIFKELGDKVQPPLSNGDRIGYVIAVGKTQETAEQLADAYVGNCHVELQ